jgi:hypothetical protein
VKQEQEQRDHLFLLLDLMFILKRRHLLPHLLVGMGYLLDHHLIRLDQHRREKLRKRWVRLIKLVNHFSRMEGDGANGR